MIALAPKKLFLSNIINIITRHGGLYKRGQFAAFRSGIIGIPHIHIPTIGYGINRCILLILTKIEIRGAVWQWGNRKRFDLGGKCISATKTGVWYCINPKSSFSYRWRR